MYRLVYFSQAVHHNIISVLGMSEAFHIQPREEEDGEEAEEH